MKKILMTGLSVFIGLTGCSKEPHYGKGYEDGVKILRGPKMTRNTTPYTFGLACVAHDISKKRSLRNSSQNFSKHLINKKNVRIAIGKIPDKTGKVNSTEGYKITQGVESMAITALSYLPNVQVVERQNLDAYRFESDLTGKKLVGDQKKYKLSNKKTINYRPLLSGSINGADYYITGAITEVNYNIYSGGKLLNIAGLEFGKRTVVMNVALDLRIVNIKTLTVIDSISLQKQFIGKRTRAGVYRFFDKELVHYNGGTNTDEPLQQGVRSLVERGVAYLVGSLFNVKTDHCFSKRYITTYQ